MKEVMKIRVVISTLFLISTMGSFACGQAVPAGMATISLDPDPFTLEGGVHYALTASEIVQLGYYASGEVTSSSALTGDMAYTTQSMVRPFSVILAGGVVLPNQSAQGVRTYVSVTALQGYVTGRWAFNVGDTFSFLPESPTTGLSGIAGVGDIGVIPGPGTGPAGGILTVSNDRIGNSLHGSVERQIGRATSISGVGSWSVLHFLDNSQENSQLNDSQTSGMVALNQRFNARSSGSVSAVYTAFDYSGQQAQQTGPNEPTNFQTRGINVSYQRVLSRTFSAGGSVGPLWVSSSNSALIPSALHVAGSARLEYSSGRSTSASLYYTQGVSGGSGVIPGGLADSVGFGAGRAYGRNWVVTLNGSYTQTSGLKDIASPGSPDEGSPNPVTPTHEVYQTAFGGVQLRRRFSTNFSGYLSYTVQHQTANYSLSTQNVLTGTPQTFGIGVTFAPRSTSLGQF
jgi:hypothetical protein